MDFPSEILWVWCSQICCHSCPRRTIYLQGLVLRCPLSEMLYSMLGSTLTSPQTGVQVLYPCETPHSQFSLIFSRHFNWFLLMDSNQRLLPSHVIPPYMRPQPAWWLIYIHMKFDSILCGCYAFLAIITLFQFLKNHFRLPVDLSV